MRSLLISVLVLACSVPALAQPPSVSLKGPPKARVDVPIIISARKSTGVVSGEWSVRDRDDIVVMTLDDKDLIAYVAFDTPGTYVVVFTAQGKEPAFVGEQKVNGQWSDAYVEFLLKYFGKSTEATTVGEFTIKVDGGTPPPPVSVNPYAAPQESVRTLVEPLTSFKLARADASGLASMYAAARSCVTTAELRDYCITEGGKLGIKSKYVGLADAVNAAWMQVVGTKVRDLTEVDQAFLSGLAWALWEAGRDR